MDKWRENLKESDNVIFINIYGWCGDTVRKITRTTKTLVIFDNYRINRNSNQLREATDEEVLKIELSLKKLNLIEKVDKLINGNTAKLSIENLEKILNILKT